MTWGVGVVVPARDEADHIAACLAALRAAIEHVGLPADRLHAVLVADSCTDATATLADPLLAGWGEVLEVEVGSPGAARALGTEVLLQRLAAIRPARLWLASTDADTVVPVDWLSRHLACARAGAMAVAGVVELDSLVPLPPGVAEEYDRIYRGPPDEEHPHVHAANLGVRADAYRAVGGWQTVARGEEHHLWLGVRERGWPTMSPRSLQVTTSSRLVSRLRGGFADWLAELAAAAAAP